MNFQLFPRPLFILSPEPSSSFLAGFLDPALVGRFLRLKITISVWSDKFLFTSMTLFSYSSPSIQSFYYFLTSLSVPSFLSRDLQQSSLMHFLSHMSFGNDSVFLFPAGPHLTFYPAHSATVSFILPGSILNVRRFLFYCRIPPKVS